VSPRQEEEPVPASSSFAELYRQHAAAVYRRCLALGGGDRAWAEDVMQDVFVKLHEKQATIESPGAVGAWLLTIADRLSFNRLRRERGVWHRVKAALVSQPPPPAPPPGEEDAEAVLAELRTALSDLPEKERAVMILKYVEGKSQREIARHLSRSEGYVSKLVARAVERLREGGWGSRDD
jgi:RNA polymerase sigma factor (sigma-70 family)